MLKAKALGKDLLPIFLHAYVHAILFYIVLAIMWGPLVAMWGSSLQLVTHFIIDVWKGRMNGWFPKLQDNTNPYHWWIFGIDQFLHQLVIIITVYTLI